MNLTKILLLPLSLLLILGTTLSAQEIIRVGKASYFHGIPAGKIGPTGPDGPLVPRTLRSAEISRPVPTNRYWSSLVFPRMNGNRFGCPVYLPPLSLRATEDGFEIGCTGRWSIDAEYHFHHENLIKINVAEAKAAGVAVSDWYETGATAHLVGEIGESLLAVSFQKSSPALVFSDFPAGKTVEIVVSGKMTAGGESPNAFGFTANDRPFGIFLDRGKLAKTENGFRVTAEKDARLTVALLPGDTKEIFAEACEVFGGDPVKPVSHWIYDKAKNAVIFTYASPDRKKTAFTLLPHQWKLLDTKTLAALNKIAGTYPSARGDAKIFFAGGVKFEIPIRGILPFLPAPEGTDAEELKAVFLKEYPEIQLAPPGTDTYWTGKTLLKVISAARIADQLGLTDERDAMIRQVKDRLEDWFTATPDKPHTFFAYEPKWGTLIGYNAGFGSDGELNDHHFHYGYFIAAAAFIAQYDPQWADAENWGGMVNLLIRDTSSTDANDPLFPRLRCFDLWEGHSWAAGHGDFAAGNNNESSSEAMLFNTSVYLWGAVTGNDKIRDHGAFLYGMEQSAIEQYWWDIDGDVFPENYPFRAVGMVWGNGAAHATWFSGASEAIHGINFLPIHAGSTYMGRHSEYVKKNFEEIAAESQNGEALAQWVDVIYSYRALGDPSAARRTHDAWFAEGSPRSEGGISGTFTKHWITSLSHYGVVDMSVTADTSAYQVFVKDGKRTYVAWNFGKTAKIVKFSDGTSLRIPPGEVVKLVR